METVKLAEKYYKTHICGFDIAADENYPIKNHISSFKYAKENGINCTAHGGEARGSESVTEILDYLKPSRLGHGVRIMEDMKLVERVKRENIHLEVCPTSNIQTNVFSTIQEHAINDIYKQNISLSINTDSRTITPVTLTEEYELLHSVFGWTKDHFLKCNLEAVKHAFVGDEIKERLSEKIVRGYR